ncbi:DMT family transporter [Paenibacillus rhizoplanae]|uniref:DMT family transporter n=1 Tax=Paenibacillus rhizoplanae TaxID=1917181 RepID=UPI003619F590
MHKQGLKLAYSFAVLNAVIIGFSFLFTKVALVHAGPLDTLTFRFAASFAVMSVPVALGWVKVSYRGKPIGRALLLAAMYPLGFFTLQVFGLQRATSAEGGILYSFTPVVTMIIAAIVLKEKTTLLQKLCIFLSVFGVVFIFVMKGSGIQLSNMTGIVLLFMTCLAFAGYSVLARSLSSHFSPAELSYLMMGRLRYLPDHLAHRTYSQRNAWGFPESAGKHNIFPVRRISGGDRLAGHNPDFNLYFIQNRGLTHERVHQPLHHCIHCSRSDLPG